MHFKECIPVSLVALKREPGQAFWRGAGHRPHCPKVHQSARKGALMYPSNLVAPQGANQAILSAEERPRRALFLVCMLRMHCCSFITGGYLHPRRASAPRGCMIFGMGFLWRVLGWGIVIYAVMYLLWSALV